MIDLQSFNRVHKTKWIQRYLDRLNRGKWKLFVKFFDTSLTAYGKGIEGIELGLNEDLEKNRLWLQANKLSLIVAKTEYMLIGSRQRLAKLPLEPNIYVLGVSRIKRVRDIKILGVYIDESLTWSKHIEEIAKTITAGISALERLRDFASRDVLVCKR